MGPSPRSQAKATHLIPSRAITAIIARERGGQRTKMPPVVAEPVANGLFARILVNRRAGPRKVCQFGII